MAIEETTSPLARALIGKEVGDVVSVRSPGGEREYEIQDIRFELGEEWNVNVCEELVAALGELDMVSDARLVY